MQIKFWGVRGSTPTPQPENMRYGGNTSCVEVRVNGQIYIFDCGTGFRNLGKQLSQEFADKPIQTHVFISHFHWDHIQGIPFFKPLYDRKDNYFYFHSSNRSRGLAACHRRADDRSVLPGRYEPDGRESKLLRHRGRPHRLRRLHHPSRSGSTIRKAALDFVWKAKDGIIVYATDNEPGHPVFDKNVRKLAEGADILIYDAQYLPEQYAACKVGWGHSHWREAVNIVMESGAKELVLFHHDPDHDDNCIDSVVKAARDYYPNVRAAAEGMEISVGVHAQQTTQRAV